VNPQAAGRRPVRIGAVGCGDALRNRYMPVVERLKMRGLAEVAMTCDHGPAKRQVMADEFGITNFTTEWQAVVESDHVDLVIITTPMREHGHVARAALAAGKHVMVEKPMAVTLEEAAELVRLARESPGYLLSAPFVVLSPTYIAMGRHLQRGDIGPVFLARGRYGWAGPNWGRWFYEADGGPLFDLGVYPLTSLTGWLGPARRVAAMSALVIPEREVRGERIRVETEDNYQVMLDFGNNCLAVVTTGFTIQQQRGAALELFGGEGTLHLMGNDHAPEGYELWQNQVGAWKVVAEKNREWRWTDGLRHIVACIQHGTPPLHTPEHAYHVLEIMIKARQAGRDGETHALESTFSVMDFEQAGAFA
jgi:predicted dehydrogenase